MLYIYIYIYIYIKDAARIPPHPKRPDTYRKTKPGTRPEIPDNSSKIQRKFMKLRAEIIENRAKMVPKRDQDEARTPKWAQVGPGSQKDQKRAQNSVILATFRPASASELQKVTKMRSKIDAKPLQIDTKNVVKKRLPKRPKKNPKLSHFVVILGSILELFGNRFLTTFLASIWSGFASILDLILVTFWSPEALAGRKVDFSKIVELLR